jgi:hypothetical protein
MKSVTIKDGYGSLLIKVKKDAHGWIIEHRQDLAHFAVTIVDEENHRQTIQCYQQGEQCQF